MSLLKSIESNFEPVSEQYFIDNEYAYSQYTRKGPMSKYGAWLKNEYVPLNFFEHDTNSFPKDQFIRFITLRFRYATDVKRFIVEPVWSSEEYMREHNITFETIRIDNPSQVDIEAAISETNLQSRFCKLSDVDFG